MNTKTLSALDAIVALLESRVGYGISLFGRLSVCQLEDGSFALNSYRYVPGLPDNEHEYERIFVTARDAAEAFETVRAERLLGHDFERDLPANPD